MAMDKLELEHFVREIHRASWNFYTQKRCLKVKFKNNTGAISVKGELVEFDNAEDNAVVLTIANSHECIGAWAEDGVAIGVIGEVIINGSVQYRLKDTTLSTAANWVKTSDVAGRADASLAAPPLGGVAQLDEHMQEVGHCNQTKTGGTNILAEGKLQFN